MEIKTCINCGIYSITNIINNKIYYGSTIDIQKRWIRHKWELNKNKHGNVHLQRAWKKYGENNFIFKIETIVKPIFLLQAEQIYIDNNINSYNICKEANSHLGVKRSEETKKKLSIINKGNKHRLGYKHTQISKEKIGVSNKGKTLGKKHSEQTKRKISISNKGKIVSQDTKEKISNSNKGKHQHLIGIPRTEEVKNKISRANKGKQFSKEHKDKLSKSHLGKIYSDDTKQKMSKTHFKRGYYFDKNRNRYRVRIKGKSYGDFMTEQEAKNRVKEILV